MGLMSSEMFNAIQDGKPVYPVLELDIGGVTKRFGAAPVDVDSLGMYEERILSWSGTTRGASLSGLSLQALNATVEIEDESRDLDRIVTGEFSRTLAGSSARGKLVSPAVIPDSYFTFYAGVIKEYRKSGPLRYAFELTTLDEPLKGRIRTPTLSKWDFPGAEDADRDTPIPLVFGKHDSASVGGPVGGMLPTIRAGTIKGSTAFVVMHGRGDALINAYVDGGSADATAAVTGYNINGRNYEVVNAFTDATPVGAVVTVDFHGLTDTGRPTGTVITSPAEQLKQLLAHWVFDERQDTRDNLAIPAGTPVDIASLDVITNFFNVHSIEGGRYLTGAETGESVVNEWCNNHSAVPYWNHEGKLAFAINDWYIDDIYDSAGLVPTFTHNDDMGDLSYVFDTELLADEISADFLYSSADNKFFRTLRVVDTIRDINRKEPKRLFWSQPKV